MKIAVVGAGYVGLAGGGAGSLGHKVFLMENNREKLVSGIVLKTLVYFKVNE